jgi:TPR repeat protein
MVSTALAVVSNEAKVLIQVLVKQFHYYRRSAKQSHVDGMYNFGLCLVSAKQGVNRDGANNFGFCLEHGRGVQQNIKFAAEENSELYFCKPQH